MTRDAEEHLSRAAFAARKGQEMYRIAAEEMRAAKDAGATWVEIAARLERSVSWCKKIVAWSESPARRGSVPTPFAEPGRDRTAYAKARQEYEERERNLTDAERRERKDAAERMVRPIRQAVATFSAMGIAQHIGQATDELLELTADASLTSDVLREVECADEKWKEALRFARAMLGKEVDGREG